MTNLPDTPAAQAHLTESQLFAVAFDGETLTAGQSRHLASCADCRTAMAVWQTLDRELAVARLSNVSDNALARYQTIFETAKVNATGVNATGVVQWFGQFTDAIKASVMWNGHARLTMQVVRNGSAVGYRMLYGTELAEIELMIEPVGEQFKIEGEVLPLQTADSLLPVWLELHKRNGPLRFSGESDSHGRFHIPAMDSGAYTLYMIPAEGAAMLVDTVELA
ncbi:MAG: hypothetical protein R2932_10915 [Caldilineaceae bacterium]